jgi:hypothetical protein
MADDDPVGEVIDGALNGVHPRVGARKALRSKLSDPLLISVAFGLAFAFAGVFWARTVPLIKR